MFQIRSYLLAVFLGCLTPLAHAAETSSDISALLARTGLHHGVCSIPECEDGALIGDVARHTKFLVHAFHARREVAEELESLRTLPSADPAHLVVEQLSATPLPYTDRFVDVLVLGARDTSVAADEAGRVVRPHGWVILRRNSQLITPLQEHGFARVMNQGDWLLLQKPALPGVDDWSHWYHRPDNNPVSTDSVIQAPYLTQWVGAPYYHAMPVVTTASAGRVFVASGHIAHHDREIPTVNMLVARNGYNGCELWRRPLPSGYLVHRSAFIATADVFFMIEGDEIVELDPETGKELARLRVPGIEGSYVWMAKVDEVLYLLASRNDPPTQMLRVGSRGRGWGWQHVDKNYSPDGKHQIRWGFGETIAAFDLTRHTVAWRHDDQQIDSRGMAILGDRIFYYVPGKRLACLDRQSGEVRWVNEDTEKLQLIEQEAQGLPGTPGFRTSALVLATPVGLFIQGQKRAQVLGFSIEDGSFLWSKHKFHNNPNMLYVNQQLMISGIEQDGAVQVIDPGTGDTLDNLNFQKGSCTRMTGSPAGLYCRGEGLGNYEFATRTYTAERTARPGCNDGALPVNGLLYVGPWLCDCNLSMLGQLTLGPAGQFAAHEQTVTAEHLQSFGQLPSGQPLVSSDADWPEYRSNVRRTASSRAVVPDGAQLAWRTPPAHPGALQAPPVAVGECLFTAGQDGVVRCLDARHGACRWTFFTGGPVLASPTVWEGRLLVGSGDGYVYCLAAADGTLLWRFRVAPVEKRIMVYGHLSSIWPVNSSVLVHDAIAYAAAGIMFRDGTHVVALDARTGQLLWHNGTTGKPINERYELQAASALGTLAVARGRLFLASGNVVAPTSFDLKTGVARVQPAQRIPEWNTVMAQKPEPAGKDIMFFADKFLLHGGRLLYSGEGPVVSASQYSFRMLGNDGLQLSPAFTPVRYCSVAPAWDADTFVMPTSQYGNVLGWNRSDVEQHLLAAAATMVELDKAIPGDTPQKWGQYGRIGQVFSTVERQLRSTSKWPVVRRQVLALALAKNAVVLTEQATPSAPYQVVAMDKESGKEIWHVELPAAPRLGSLAIDRHGRVLVALADGSIACVSQ